MKIELNIKDWGNHVITLVAKNADQAIRILYDVSEKHPGAAASACIGSECIELDFAESPDFEGEILKLERKVLKAKQIASAQKTNQNYSSEKRKEAAKKAWKTKKGIDFP